MTHNIQVIMDPSSSITYNSRQNTVIRHQQSQGITFYHQIAFHKKIST